jgi:predicted transposase/invertase (TIGR01784 family)
MKTVFADPKTDVIFKKLFGQKAHQHLLVELLNSLLELEGKHRIVDVEYLTPEQVPPRHDLKLSMLDVKCTDASGTHYVVEMQVIAVEGFQKRVVYNACKAYVLQLGAGDDYPQLSGVIAVTLCNFVLWPQKDHSDDYKVPMLSRWRMQEQHGGERGLGEVQYVFLELPKYQADQKPKTTVEKWAYFFREARSLETDSRGAGGGPVRRGAGSDPKGEPERRRVASVRSRKDRRARLPRWAVPGRKTRRGAR